MVRMTKQITLQHLRRNGTCGDVLKTANREVIRASTFHAWSRCVTEMRLEREYAGQVNDLESRFLAKMSAEGG
eukprot:325355-Amphidinium_carterae.1